MAQKLDKNPLEDVVQDEKAEVKVAVESPYPMVKYIQHFISKNPIMPQEGSITVLEGEAEITGWLHRGFRIQNAFFAGENPFGYNLFYILVHD